MDLCVFKILDSCMAYANSRTKNEAGKTVTVHGKTI